MRLSRPLLVAFTLLVAAACCYVPWQQVSTTETGDKLTKFINLGYSWAWDPPSGISENSRIYQIQGISINWGALSTELAAIALGAVVAFKAVANKQTKK